jgi:hypothetical protein
VVLKHRGGGLADYPHPVIAGLVNISPGALFENGFLDALWIGMSEAPFYACCSYNLLSM